MNRLVYFASLWVCLAAIQALGQEVVQSSPDRSPVQGAGSPGSVIPLPPASRPRPQPDTPAPPRGTTSAPVPDQAWPRSPGGQPPGARPPAGSPTPSAPAPSPAPALALARENVFAQALADSSPDLTSFEGFSRAGIPQMLGDQGALFGALRQAGPNVARVPYERGYKMADNQSPMPQDRFFVAFNFYDNLNTLATRGEAATLYAVKLYREFFGFEKTFFDQRASIGIRLPLNTLSAQSDVPGLAGTSTALGDLTVFVKYALYRDFARGRLLSSGLAVTPPTGPGALAGSPIANSLHAAALQPFLGYIYSLGPNVFIQGFSGVNVPTDPGVVTMMYNDMAIGYFLYRDESGQNRFLGAIVPTFEVHVSTPLNHRLAIGPQGFTGTPDVVDLTFGAGFVLGGAVLSTGIVNPVTGPRPFDLEVVAQLNVLFGKSRSLRTAIPPPVIGP
ncbi:MAG: hypothetical protein ACXWOV_12840 [Isosphaeraceae bacterium]